MSATLVALLLLQAAAPGRPPASNTDLPMWSKTPTAAEANAVYPPAAAAANFAGSATVECTVKADGGLADCAVVGESTPGAGFGAAALQLAPKFQMPAKSPSGSPMAGRTVQFPVRWLGDAKSQAPAIVVYDDVQTGPVIFNCRVTPDRGFDNCVVVDAKPQGSTLFGKAGEAALRQKAPRSAKAGGRLMVVVQVKNQN
jgi:TonB family protein